MVTRPVGLVAHRGLRRRAHNAPVPRGRASCVSRKLRGTGQGHSVSRAVLPSVRSGRVAYCDHVRLEKRRRSRRAVEHSVDRHPDVRPHDPVNASCNLPCVTQKEQDSVVLGDVDRGITRHADAVEERTMNEEGAVSHGARPEEGDHCDSVLPVNSRPLAELSCSTDGHVPVPCRRVREAGATDSERQQSDNDRPTNHARPPVGGTRW